MRFSFFLLLSFLFLGLSGPVLAQTKVIENSGFVPGNIWFSKAPETPGESVKIYTLVWNASPEDITGSVSFFDSDTLIGKQDFILTGSESSKVLSVPWTVKDGYHKIYAQITESSGGLRGKTTTSVVLEYAKTDEAEQFIKPPVKESAGATTTVSNYLDEKTILAKEYVSANLPKPVTDTAKSAVSGIENLRDDVKLWSEQTVKTLKKDLDISATSAKDSETPEKSGWFGAERPIKYVELFLLSLFAFILGNGIVFYGILTLTVFFILRFIKRKFFF